MFSIYNHQGIAQGGAQMTSPPGATRTRVLVERLSGPERDVVVVPEVAGRGLR